MSMTIFLKNKGREGLVQVGASGDCVSGSGVSSAYRFLRDVTGIKSGPGVSSGVAKGGPGSPLAEEADSDGVTGLSCISDFVHR